MTGKQNTGKRTRNPVDVHVGQRVRMCRVSSGLSQTDLAKQLGISFQQIQKYENGVNRVGAGRLFDIARLLNVSVDTLFPSANGSQSRSIELDEEFKEILEFVSGVDGLRLCLSFLRIDSTATRKLIVALVQQISISDKARDGAHPPNGRH
jgi:transcriptional regulator with XRE-family HTH domain